MKVFSRYFAAAVLVTSTGFAAAQVTSGNIAGVVKDATGAAVPNATITVKSEATGVVTNSKANASGEYLVQNLLPAKYDITANSTGFAPAALIGVNVTLNSTATADLALQTGQQSSVVEVNANSEVVLDTTTQNLSQTFSNQELSTLPNASIGEGVLNTSLLAPGVASSGGIGIGVGPSIGGQRPRSNNFMIEGVDNNNKAVTGPLVYVPNDAVGDFTLITNQFSPEFGHSAGGQFNTNIVTGTNHFHGRVYEYNQNRDLNAASGIAGGKVFAPRYDNNRYGGQLGGPILKDKLFFFGNFERNTIGQSAAYFLCTPTAAGLAQLNALAATDGFSTNNLAQYTKYTPPATITGAGGAGIDASVDNACGNQATGAQYLTVLNAAGGNAQNIPLGNYQVATPYFTNIDALTTGADWTISSSDSMRFRYIYNTEGTTDTAAALPTFFTTIPFKNHLATISEFHNFTPNLINEVRVGFNRYYNTTPSGDFTYPGLDSFPNLTIGDQASLNIGPDPNAPQFTVQNLYQITDNVSWTKGSHTLRFGFDGRKYISPQGFTQRARGDYEYSGLNIFLHDLAPDAFGERSTGNHTYYGDQTALYGYANDTWRVTPKLTVNYGLRYEFTSVPTGERAQALNSVASVPGLITFHAPQPSYTNLFPRVGIEYAPDSKTSIRLGFGLAGDVLFDNLGTLSFPPQYSTTQDVGSGTAPAALSPNFLANGGLPAGTGSGTVVLTAAEAKAETSAYLPNQVVPYSENYTLTMQRTVSNGLVAEIGYIGTRGIHLPTQIQYNVQPRVNATNVLPTYINGNVLEGAGSGATNLAAIQALSNFLPQFLAAGFDSKITSYQPYSGSNYNALIANLQGRTHFGLQLNASYTFSKAMDNATAEVFSTVLTPRRPQNSQNLNADYSRSALDRTHRITLEADYNFQPFKPNENWVIRNIVGNWIVAPIYTYESPEYATALSGDNANLNGDSALAIDRPLVNVHGTPGTGTGVTAITAGGQTVGYTANNPNAYYVQAGLGTLPTASRNTLPIRPIDNIDLSVFKRFAAFERYNLELGAQAFNLANHAQYQPGSLDNVNGPGYTSSYNFQTVTSAFFNRPDKEFLNQARTIQLSAKFLF
ncbi:MAG: carboxypeptidase regulatory-like domain-containing protein [Janthinobacterium lividum]